MQSHGEKPKLPANLTRERGICMKHYKATYRRENIKLKEGGYEIEKLIKAETPEMAKKKAESIDAVYGGLQLIDIEEM